MTTFDEVVIELKKRREQQDVKWGPNRRLPAATWLTIIIEEVGEVAEAILENQPSNIFDELLDVAATCIAWMETLWVEEE